MCVCVCVRGLSPGDLRKFGKASERRLGRNAADGPLQCTLEHESSKSSYWMRCYIIMCVDLVMCFLENQVNPEFDDLY